MNPLWAATADRPGEVEVVFVDNTPTWTLTSGDDQNWKLYCDDYGWLNLELPNHNGRRLHIRIPAERVAYWVER